MRELSTELLVAKMAELRAGTEEALRDVAEAQQRSHAIRDRVAARVAVRERTHKALRGKAIQDVRGQSRGDRGRYDWTAAPVGFGHLM